MTAPRKEFSWIEAAAFCLSAIAIQLTSETTAQWGTYFYSPSDTGRRIIYISIGTVWFVFLFSRLIDGITDPLIGIWSDKMRTAPGQWRIPRIAGRRRPFIFWGSILTSFTMIAMWFPPRPETSWLNFCFALFVVSLHWVFWTICVIPLNSLVPEVARSKAARVKLGTAVALGMILGLAAVEIGVPSLVAALDPARKSGGFSPVGYQRASLIMSAVSLVLFQLVVWCVRERYEDRSYPSEESTWVPRWSDIATALRNRPCQIYLASFFFFNVGLLAVQKSLPYWAEIGLGGDEGTVAQLMVPFFVAALVTYTIIPAVSRRVHVKWLLFLAFGIFTAAFPAMYLVAVLRTSLQVKTLLGGVLFGLCGIGQALFYVVIVPVLGEIIDLDEQITGKRREAVFGGLSGIAVKVGQALSVTIATQLMHLYGHSPERPLGVLLVGPVAGVFGVLGMIVIVFYPVLHVTKETTEELVSSEHATSSERQ